MVKHEGFPLTTNERSPANSAQSSRCANQPSTEKTNLYFFVMDRWTDCCAHFRTNATVYRRPHSSTTPGWSKWTCQDLTARLIQAITIAAALSTHLTTKVIQSNKVQLGNIEVVHLIALSFRLALSIPLTGIRLWFRHYTQWLSERYFMRREIVGCLRVSALKRLPKWLFGVGGRRSIVKETAVRLLLFDAVFVSVKSEKTPSFVAFYSPMWDDNYF